MLFKKPTEESTSRVFLPSYRWKSAEILGLLFMISMILPQHAFGYIDMGSGSYFLQILLAALFAGLYAIKVFWANIKLFFRKFLSEKKRQ